MSNFLNKSYAVHVLLSITALLHAGNYAVAKVIMPAFLSPFSLILIRLFMAGVMFWVVSLFLPQPKLSFQDHKRLLFCALAGGSANMLFFFWGLSYTNASNASLIMTISPVFVLMFSVFLLKERLSNQKWVGIIIGFSGAILLGQHSLSTSGSVTFLGDMMVLVNAVLYALYLVLVKPMTLKYHPITLFKWITLYGVLLLLPFCFNDFTAADWGALPDYVWWCIAYVIIGATFLTFIINAYALKMANASLVGIYIYVQPILATFIAIILGQEFFSLSKLLIAIYIFFGVYLVGKKAKPKLKG